MTDHEAGQRMTEKLKRAVIAHYLARWKQLYENGGDFGKIGVTIHPEAVPRFDKFVAGIRRDRVPVSLLRDAE